MKGFLDRDTILYENTESGSKLSKRIRQVLINAIDSEDVFKKIYGLMKEDVASNVDSNLIRSIAYCCSCIYDTEKNSLYGKEYDELISEFKGIQFDKWNTSTWRKLYLYAELHGLFRLACVIREKYKKLLYYDDSEREMWRKVQCSIEDFRLDNTKHYLEIMSKDDKYIMNCRQELTIASWFLNVVSNGLGEIDSFSKYVKNRKIHIYGPMQCEDKRSSSDDIVVRIDDRINRKSNDRTNIIYINGDVCEMMKDYPKEYWERFDVVSLKKNYELSYCKNARNMKNFGCLFLFGFPNMIPLILIDLLCAGAETIFVSGINLYCSKHPYGEGYEGFTVMQDHIQRRERILDWCIHDVLSQFCFMKNLYNQRTFLADDDLKYVMNMSWMDYAYNMERQHVPGLLELA